MKDAEHDRSPINVRILPRAQWMPDHGQFGPTGCASMGNGMTHMNTTLVTLLSAPRFLGRATRAAFLVFLSVGLALCAATARNAHRAASVGLMVIALDTTASHAAKTDYVHDIFKACVSANPANPTDLNSKLKDLGWEKVRGDTIVDFWRVQVESLTVEMGKILDGPTAFNDWANKIRTDEKFDLQRHLAQRKDFILFSHKKARNLLLAASHKRPDRQICALSLPGWADQSPFLYGLRIAARLGDSKDHTFEPTSFEDEVFLEIFKSDLNVRFAKDKDGASVPGPVEGRVVLHQSRLTDDAFLRVNPPFIIKNQLMIWYFPKGE